jgi:hypothetical protein
MARRSCSSSDMATDRARFLFPPPPPPCPLERPLDEFPPPPPRPLFRPPPAPLLLAPVARALAAGARLRPEAAAGAAGAAAGAAAGRWRDRRAASKSSQSCCISSMSSCPRPAATFQFFMLQSKKNRFKLILQNATSCRICSSAFLPQLRPPCQSFPAYGGGVGQGGAG